MIYLRPATMAMDCGGDTLMSSWARFEIKFAVGGTQVVIPPMTLLFSLLSFDRFIVISECKFVGCFLMIFSFAFRFGCDDGRDFLRDAGCTNDSNWILSEYRDDSTIDAVSGCELANAFNS